jgi:hypothetical protein
MTYSLDNQERQPVPLVEYYFGSPIINEDNWERNHIDGSAVLPKQSEGSHELTVFLDYWERGSATSGRLEYCSDNQTVHFAILLDKNPPAITNLSLQNRTYNSTDIPLNFNVNETTSRISYSLDNCANVTMDGNMTLTGLLEGSHTLAVYANDTSGNVGMSQTIFFTVKKETMRKIEPNPTLPFVVAFIVIVAVFIVGILVYFKKRGKEQLQDISMALFKSWYSGDSPAKE